MAHDPVDSEPTWYGELDLDEIEPAPAPARDRELGVSEAKRYTHVRFLGAGSIGTVALCFDRRLGRHVAYKALREDVPVGPSSVMRFLREATINAQLNHPGIVPVFDAGLREDGARYYTMRLVKGRTMQEAMAACAGLDDRLALLDRYADLCQAMAYAHARGVVHRDLKPANVMLGEFGETQIIDWGLARTRPATRGADTATLRERDALCSVDEPTQAGSIMGTPRYMSPEQAMGATDRIDQRSDVFALGAILYELLTGRPPFPGDDAHEVLARVRVGRFAPVLELEADAPGDLAAIAEKALCFDPADRYPSAQQLAEDIDRWRRGALVGAYAYRPKDHLRRFATKNRQLLLVAALALLVILVSGAVAAARVVQERNRAVEAEARATDRLATSFVLQADAAREAGRWPLAELYAASALAIREDPVARGVIAGSWARPALRLVGTEPGPPDCDEILLEGDTVSCMRANQFTIWRRGAFATPLLSLEAPDGLGAANAGRFAWIGDDELRLYDAATGALVGTARHENAQNGLPLADGGAIISASREVLRVDPATGAQRWLTAVSGVVTDLVLSGDGARLLLGTRDAYATELDAATGAVLRSFGPVPSMAGAVAYSWDGATVLVGAGSGELFAFDRATGAQRFSAGRFGAAITGVFALPGLALSRVEDGSVRVYSDVDGRELAAVYDSAGARRGVAVDRQRRELLTAGGGALRRWSVDELSRRALFTHDEGLLDVELSPRGNRLVTLTGGRVGRLFGLPDGAEITRWQLSPATGGRRAVFTTDGTRVLSGEFYGPTRLWRASDGADMGSLAVPGRLLATSATRVATEGAAFTPGASTLSVSVADLATGQPLFELHTQAVRDLDLSQDGRTLAFALRDEPEVVVVTDVGEPSPQTRTLRTTEVVTGLSLSPDGARLAWGIQSGDVLISDLSGQELLRLRGHTHLVQRIAWTEDGRRLATAGWDGTARVWDATTGVALAELRGHEHRVWSVSFSADGQTLATGSWDRTARLWDLRALDQPASALLETLRRRHGLELVEARPALVSQGPAAQ